MPAPTLVAGAPCWIDLYSSDTDKAKEFYGRLLGWSAEPPEEGFGGYFVFTKDGKVVAGCMGNSGEEGYPDAWTIYLTTDDAARTVNEAKANGGQVHLEPMEIASNGTMAMVADPGNAAVGVWQPGAMQGFEVRGEPGTGAWFELLTRDYEACVDFYRDVFGWDTHVAGDTPEFRYTTLGEGEGRLAGIMDASAFLSEDQPAKWFVYFEVENADTALAQVVELGGSIVDPAVATPYGRLAVVADPTGTTFKLVEGNS